MVIRKAGFYVPIALGLMMAALFLVAPGAASQGPASHELSPSERIPGPANPQPPRYQVPGPLAAPEETSYNLEVRYHPAVYQPPLLDQQYTLEMAVDGNGSGVVTPTVGVHTYEYGTTVWLTATAHLSSTFDGWSGSVSGPTNPISVTMDSDKVVTATFTLKQHTLEMAVDGSGSGVVTPTVGIHTYDYGTIVWMTATASLASTFDGWTGAVSGTTDPISVTMDSDKVVTATFESNSVYLPLVVRSYPPTPIGHYVRIHDTNMGYVGYTYHVTVTLELSATIQGDTVEWVLLSSDGSDWTERPFAPTADWVLNSGNGLQTVYARFKGHLGGVSPTISGDSLLFKNGDFAQPNLDDWTQAGVLHSLPAFDPQDPANPVGLLGDPAYGCNGAPVGYASLSQFFEMPGVPAGKHLILRFSYHIYSYDRNIGLTDTYDRFDVLLDNTLVLKDANQGDFDGCTTLHDVGRKEAAITVAGVPGQQMKVDFRVYNRPDNLYNTFVYIDNIYLVFE